MNDEVKNKLQLFPLFYSIVEKSPNMVLVVAEDMSLMYCNSLCLSNINPEETTESYKKKPLNTIFHLSDEQIYSVTSELKEKGKWQGELNTSTKELTEWGLIESHKYTNPPDDSVCYVFIRIDITEQKVNERIMYQRANFDSITMLPNINSLYETFTYTNYAEKEGKKFGAVTLVLDNLSYIEEVFGGRMANQLLKMVANQLLNIAGNKESLFSTAQGEYTFLLERETLEEIDSFAEKTLKAVKRSYLVNKLSIFLNASVGISVYPDECDDAGLLLLQARAAIKTLKGTHSGVAVHFDQSIMRGITRRIAINQLLHTVVENNELWLVFQPKYDTFTKRISGAEVLLRWTSPHLGDVPTPEFISVAEEYGHIAGITKWVFRETCRQASKWRNQGICDIEFAINIPAMQLYDIDFLNALCSIANAEGFPMEQLDIEITESVLVENTHLATMALEQMQSQKMRVAIDDFGTGYSSLAYLTKLPIDYLKIDRSFIMNIPSDLKSKGIVSTIVAMGRSLGMKIIAEGVETIEQYEFLKELGCDQIQGYLFSKPLKADEFSKLLQKEHSQAS